MLEICNPGNEPVSFASDYQYIDSFHARIQKCLSEGVKLCNTDNMYIFRGERIQIPLKAGQHPPANETPFNSVIAMRISGDPDQYC